MLLKSTYKFSSTSKKLVIAVAGDDPPNRPIVVATVNSGQFADQREAENMAETFAAAPIMRAFVEFVATFDPDGNPANLVARAKEIHTAIPKW